MLRHEYHVEQNTDGSQSKLDRITGDTRPVRLEGSINDKLKNGQNSTCKIEKDLANAPADR